MKAARAGLEGTNKMHYEFTNARAFTSTNNSGGRNFTKGRQIPQQKGLETLIYFCPFQAYLTERTTFKQTPLLSVVVSC